MATSPKGKARKIPDAPRSGPPGDHDMNDRLVGQAMAFQSDPMDLAVFQEYLEGLATHSRFSVYALRQMARTPWDSAILGTRLNQVDLFSRPQEGPHSLGFAIRMRDHDGAIKGADRKEADRLTTLMLNCGEYQQPHHKFTRPAFSTLLREITYDSLVLDALSMEIVPKPYKKAKDGMFAISHWMPVDAGTIFRATPNNPYGEYDADDCHYMQIINEQQTARWRPGELCFEARRTRTDIKNHGYGYPELCEMVDLITGLLYGLVHNMNFFKQGGPRGILAVMGQMPERQFRAFQKQLLFAGTGVKNAFRMILANPQGADADLKFVPFGAPNREMEFAEWNNWLFKMMCAIRQIDPAEVGIHYSSDGDRQPMFAASPEAKLQAGRDKGLRPLLSFLQRVLNQYIVSRLNPEFEIQFLGVGSMSEKDEADLDKAMLEGPRTLNEVRALKDLPSKGPAGEVFLNPYWLQHKQAVDQAAAQEQGGGQGMGEPVPGAGGPQPEQPGQPEQQPGGAADEPGAPGGEGEGESIDDILARLPPLPPLDGKPAKDTEKDLGKILRVEIVL